MIKQLIIHQMTLPNKVGTVEQMEQQLSMLQMKTMFEMDRIVLIPVEGISKTKVRDEASMYYRLKNSFK